MIKTIEHRSDLCIVGGGLAGLCAAVAAARRGTRVVLMHDRPMLGGNASSEIRMWVCGAHGPDNRETGLIEEILLDNLSMNPSRSYSLWDSILYGKVRDEENITLLLNCSCTDAEMDGNTIRSIKGWQSTTQTWHKVEAPLFADCSGDSILAPLTGADFRMGREASHEFGEDIEPPEADRKTMGMSLLLMARETDRPQPFTPPAWANVYPTEDSFPHRGHDLRWCNWWWIELGGDMDSIGDTEILRDELLKVTLGVWDHIKNHGDHGAENWALDWFGFLPGKRESRRYMGDHIITQNDVRSGGHFPDTVAYGGWSMDDHHPAGFNYPGPPTIFHPAPSPYGLPYRALYSRNVDNLFFAGRNISATHAALSSTRVMATCSILGQAMGTAAAIATARGTTPRGVYENHVSELQQALMDDGCFLPDFSRGLPAVVSSAALTASEGDPGFLRNGIERPMGGIDNAWTCTPGSDWAEYAFEKPVLLHRSRLVLDSDLDRREHNMPCYYPLNPNWEGIPTTLVRNFKLIARLAGSEEWVTVAEVRNNHQRLVNLNLDPSVTVEAIRLIPESSWGSETCRIFSWDFE